MKEKYFDKNKPQTCNYNDSGCNSPTFLFYDCTVQHLENNNHQQSTKHLALSMQFI
jgi:hypothetical protein